MKTYESASAYINAQVMLCRIELEGMLAENQDRLSNGLTLAYLGDHFTELREKYEVSIGHNATMSLFKECK